MFAFYSSNTYFTCIRTDQISITSGVNWKLKPLFLQISILSQVYRRVYIIYLFHYLFFKFYFSRTDYRNTRSWNASTNWLQRLSRSCSHFWYLPLSANWMVGWWNLHPTNAVFLLCWLYQVSFGIGTYFYILKVCFLIKN